MYLFKVTINFTMKKFKNCDPFFPLQYRPYIKIQQTCGRWVGWEGPTGSHL